MTSSPPDTTTPPPSPHQRVDGDRCSCGTVGFVSLLSCGHEIWTHGAPERINRRGGAWISCYPNGCQTQRRILSVRRADEQRRTSDGMSYMAAAASPRIKGIDLDNPPAAGVR